MTDINTAYYTAAQPGRNDYWRKMAAPRFRARTVLKLLQTFPWKSLVDLGCGDGSLLLEIRRAHPGARLAGVDLAVPQLDINKQRQPDIAWRAADLNADAPIAGGADFDVVIASEIIEHLTDPARFLRGAAGWATPARGRLILSTQSGRVGETERRVGHRRHFTVEEMTDLLRAAGWTPRRVWNCGFPFHDASKRVANWFPDAAMDRFSARPYGPFQNAACVLLRGLFRFNSDRRGAQLFAVADRGDH